MVGNSKYYIEIQMTRKNKINIYKLKESPISIIVAENIMSTLHENRCLLYVDRKNKETVVVEFTSECSSEEMVKLKYEILKDKDKILYDEFMIKLHVLETLGHDTLVVEDEDEYVDAF